MTTFITLVDFDGDPVFVNVDQIAYAAPRRDREKAINGCTIKMVGPVGHQLIRTPHTFAEVVDMIADAIGRSIMNTRFGPSADQQKES